MAKSNKYYPSELPFLSDSFSSAEQGTSKRRTSINQEPTPRKRDASSTERKNSPKLKIDYQSVMDGDSPLYLQLHIENLAIYLNCGLFYPVAWEQDAIYKENREARPDILSKFPNYLVFSPGVITAFRERDILLEIVLTPQEKGQLEVIGPCLLYPDALPISRIKQIMFSSEAAQIDYLASRAIFDDFFFPESLIVAKSRSLSNNALPTINGELPATDSAEFISRAIRFNKILGMLAFMKNASLLRANYTRKLVDWDFSFLTALALINGAISPVVATNTYIFRTSLVFELTAAPDDTSERRKLLHDIITHIYADEIFTYEWAVKTLTKYPGLHQFVLPFEDLQAEGITSFKSVINYFRKQDPRPDFNLPLILLVLLSKFNNRDRAHTDKQAVRNYFFQEEAITESEASVCTAILGLYYGYQSMVRDDKNFKLTDRFFSTLAPDINRIKFQLDSFLDRFVIESVFQYAYRNNHSLDDRFDYLRNKQEPYSSTPPIPNGYTSRPLVILGNSIINVDQSKWTSYIERLPLNIPLSHPVVNILSALSVGIPRDTISKMLDSLPKEHEAVALEFLSSLLQNKNEAR
jgi:hypothetical protein